MILALHIGGTVCAILLGLAALDDPKVEGPAAFLGVVMILVTAAAIWM